MFIINYYIIINDIIINSALSLTTKKVGMAHGTTITILYIQALALLSFAKDKIDINGFLNFSFQQSGLEFWVLQNMRVVEPILN